MKYKKTKRLRNYVVLLLMICILLGLILDELTYFFIGCYAGWNKVDDIENAKRAFGNSGEIIGEIVIGSAFVIISIICYRKLRKKVTNPIECLVKDMKEVSKGNLGVRSPLDADFEIVEIQKSFNLMVEELEQAKKLKEATEQRNQQLYTGIAHDLKTPMTMIMGYAKVLEQDKVSSQEDKKYYVKTIIEQTEHINALLDALLAYTKLENSSYQLKKEKADIVECLRECVANCYPVFEEAKIQMELVLPDYGIEYTFDRVEMKRVFINLLSNMVKHNPVETACVIQMEEICDKENNRRSIRMIVADDGPKIPNDLQSMIFDMFVVGDESRNTKNGSGLGLSISKKIIERHGGKLSYINDWKDGFKCFEIELNKD